jgi:hypothetical protein
MPESEAGMSTAESDYRLSGLTVLWFLALALALLGGVALGAGFYQAPERTWINLLLTSHFLIGVALGGLVLVALHYVTGARWSTALRRVPEAMTAALPVAAVGLAAVFIRDVLSSLSGLPSLYFAPASGGPESPLHRVWENRAFFLMRSLIYLAVWIAFAVVIVGNSRRRDRDRDPAPAEKNVSVSALFLVVFGVTCWLASTDWLMSLERNWASTIFGVYNFAGLLLSALAAVTLLVLWLRGNGALRGVVNEDHLHDLGTLLFAMSSFWMYAWFCQYMLIWYVNNPEETSYLRLRWQGSWPIWLFVALALNWAVPFVVLLFRSAKRNPWVLGTVALLVLVGRWVDLALMILPTQAGASQVPGWLEAGLLLGAVGVFVLVVVRSLRKAPLVPLHEPLS